MEEKQLLAKVRDNIFHLSASMQDAPYLGVSGEQIRGVNYAIDKILEGTGMTLGDIIKEGFKNMDRI